MSFHTLIDDNTHPLPPGHDPGTCVFPAPVVAGFWDGADLPEAATFRKGGLAVSR